MTKLRHPNLLMVVSGLAETKDTLEFVTEPIISSLATVIASSAAWVLGVKWWECMHILSYQFNSGGAHVEEIEIGLGIIDVTWALAFCHNDAHIVHGMRHGTTVRYA